MIGNSKAIMDFLFYQDKDKIFEVKEVKKHRTLTQNAYAWSLINELANVLKLSKEETYLKMLKDYGQVAIVSLKSDININGFFKYYEVMGTGVINDKEFIHYKIFKRSSEFDKKEMAIFLDGIIQECENVGIPTLTKEQIDKLK
jgi:hypothetical protein